MKPTKIDGSNGNKDISANFDLTCTLKTSFLNWCINLCFHSCCNQEIDCRRTLCSKMGKKFFPLTIKYFTRNNSTYLLSCGSYVMLSEISSYPGSCTSQVKYLVLFFLIFITFLFLVISLFFCSSIITNFYVMAAKKRIWLLEFLGD